MKNITVHLPQQQLDKMDELILQELFSNRSELVRASVRKLIMKHSHLLEGFRGKNASSIEKV